MLAFISSLGRVSPARSRASPAACSRGSFLPRLQRRPGRAAAPLAQSLRSPRQASLRMTATEAAETYEFQAEVARVMDIIVHSLYSNPDIFLRELVSNASDACDKKRFLSLSSASEGKENTLTEQLAIRVVGDENDKTVTVTDSGIGMSKSELINNLGQIAASGTAKFVEAIKEGAADVSLIGRFGVGFYSAFLVADRVIVRTKSPNDAKAWRWESEQSKNYTIAEEPDPASFLPEGATSGTSITLHIKAGMEQYLTDYRLRSLLDTYSEFVSFPIYLWTSHTEYEKKVEKDEKTGEEKERSVPRTEKRWEQVNKTKPIWLRKPSEVTDTEYAEFYKSISRDWNEPAARSHFAAEGEVEFRALLFVPKQLPFEMTQNMFSEASKPIRLYVKRVFISDKFEELLPRWLSFIRGVVDSEDLPLNVSREILQQSKVARIIGKRLVRKSVDMFREIMGREKKDEYITFWENFGRYLKVGAFEDQEWSKELLPLLRFHTSQRGEAWVGFDDYIKEMKADQKKRIFYLAAEDRTAAANSPLLEKLNKRGYEVFLLLEPVDELVIQQLNGKYLDDYKLIDVAKADALDDLDAESAADKEQQSKELSELETEYEPLCRWMQDLMQETVEKVKISKRLTDSPAAVSLSAYAMSPTMERFMKAQATMLKDRMPAMTTQKKILEINPSHPIVKRLLAQVKGGNSADKDAALLMYETALLQAGYSVTDLAAYAQRVNKALTQSVDQGDASPANGSEFGDKAAASSGSNEPSSESVTPEVVDESLP